MCYEIILYWEHLKLSFLMQLNFSKVTGNCKQKLLTDYHTIFLLIVTVLLESIEKLILNM